MRAAESKQMESSHTNSASYLNTKLIVEQTAASSLG